MNEKKKQKKNDEGDPPKEDYPSIRRTDWVRKDLFRVNKRKWNDWRWQLRNRLTNNSYYEKNEVAPPLPMAITPYYYSVVYGSIPISNTVYPTENELIKSDGEYEDPLNEDGCSPVEGIVHRYPDRVLFLVTDQCATYCRYCTRSRRVGRRECATQSIEAGIKYINDHVEIRDVLISGGDPLTIDTFKLSKILMQLRSISHVDILRIGTKVPVVLPCRITKELVRMLKKYAPLYINIHFTHPDEITPEVEKACAMLADAGIPLGSQTVLLKGVNDDPEIIKELMLKLIKIRVKPYYLYQCDPIIGSAHFRTNVNVGKEIIKKLQGWITGFAVPKFVIDAPGGGGKIPIGNDGELGAAGRAHLLLNYKNEHYCYTDPS
jgi:lysine 2,3-aminomutase